MSALPNNLSSTAFFSTESFPEQMYFSQALTETSRCSNPGILQNNFFSTIQTSMSSISEFVYTEDDLSPYISNNLFCIDLESVNISVAQDIIQPLKSILFN